MAREPRSDARHSSCELTNLSNETPDTKEPSLAERWQKAEETAAASIAENWNKPQEDAPVEESSPAKAHDWSSIYAISTDQPSAATLETRQQTYGRETSRGGWFYVLYDNGADEHCCPPGFAQGLGGAGKVGRELRDASGTVISRGPWRSAHFEIFKSEDATVRASASMVVSNIARAVMSSGKLTRAGFIASLDLANPYLQRNGVRPCTLR